MRTIKILDEFSDYRAYVSHTLCKNRLFLGLDTQNGAKRRVGDASVWPLTGTESLQLVKLTGTLFGMVSKPFKSDVSAPIKKTVSNMGKQAKLLLKGEDGAYKIFYANATQLKHLLSSISVIFRENPPGFSEKAVLKYFDGRDRKALIGTFSDIVSADLKPCVSWIVRGDEVAASYSEFWKVYSRLQTKYREINVAGAVENISEKDDEKFRQAFRDLQKVERVISCWSPNIEESDRSSTVEYRLKDEGFKTVETLPIALEKIIETL